MLNKTHVIPISLGSVSVFFIKGKNTILVDTGHLGNEDKILKRAYENGIKPEDIKLIIITHGHNDHFGGAAAFKKKTGAKIAVHKNDSENLEKGVNVKFYPYGKLGRFLSKFVGDGQKTKCEGVRPDIIMEDHFSLKDFGIMGDVIWTPRHTPGSMSVILESGEIIIGDLLMGLFPRRKPQYPVWATDKLQLKESIKKIMIYSPKQIYASHGGPFTPKQVNRIIQNFK
jgi:glyoxylase-like metal-dependent hydrolase (beta-lactamase superfamily II)